MHSATTGRFITSKYYMKDYPDWWKTLYELKFDDGVAYGWQGR